MPKLKAIIPPQNFELVRDRLAIVVGDELAHQYFISQGAGMDPDVWVERFVPIDHTDTPAINISFARGDFSGKDAVGVEGSYIYNIDFYTSAPYSNATQGDTAAALKLHKLIGMVRAILEHPEHRTLDFPPPSLGGVRVTSINIGDPETENDSVNIARGRLTFEVSVIEGIELAETVALGLSTTVVKLYNTDKGYRYIADNNEGRVYVDANSTPYESDDDKTFKPTS